MREGTASTRAVPRLAWSPWALSVALTVLAVLLLVLNLNNPGAHVYGALTVTLALLYFGVVTATQAVFQGFTGEEALPQLAVVGSTLAIAALFNPLRRRIQAFIDRGFYRRKYDAAKTLEDLASKLRNETDLAALSGDILTDVSDTMQPEHASLWLRDEIREAPQEFRS